MRFKRRFKSPKSPPEVLRLIADFRYLKSWDDSVESVVAIEEVFGQGAQYKVRVRFGGKLIDMIYTVTSYEPGARALLTGIASNATAIDIIEVRDDSNGTQVDYTAKIQLAFPYNLLDPILALGFRKTVDRAVAGLTRFLST